MVAPVEIRVRDDELRRGRAPRGEILGCVRIADEGRVVAAHEGSVQGRAHALVRLRAHHDEAPDGELGEQRLEGRLLERVRIALLDERFALVRAQLRDDLPWLASLDEVVARVLHPDDRNLGRAGFLHHGADVGDDRVAFIGVTHDPGLHVDHEQCGVRAIVECRHGSPDSWLGRRTLAGF